MGKSRPPPAAPRPNASAPGPPHTRAARKGNRAACGWSAPTAMAIPRSVSPAVSPGVRPAPGARPVRAPRPRHGPYAFESVTMPPSSKPHGHGNRRKLSSRGRPVARASQVRWPKAHAWAVCGAPGLGGWCKPGSCIGWLPPHFPLCALPPGLQQDPVPGHGPRRWQRSPPLPNRRMLEGGFASDILSTGGLIRVQQGVLPFMKLANVLRPRLQFCRVGTQILPHL